MKNEMRAADRTYVLLPALDLEAATVGVDDVDELLAKVLKNTVVADDIDMYVSLVRSTAVDEVNEGNAIWEKFEIAASVD